MIDLLQKLCGALVGSLDNIPTDFLQYIIASQLLVSVLLRHCITHTHHIEGHIHRRKTEKSSQYKGHLRNDSWFKYSSYTSTTTHPLEGVNEYSGSSDKGPSEIGTTSLQRTLVAAPC